jgi:hydrogenase/urease accessory protein HupE
LKRRGAFADKYLSALTALGIWLGADGARALAHQQTTTFGEVTYPDTGADGGDLSWKLRVRVFDLAALLDGGGPGIARGATNRRARAVATLSAGLRVSATVGGEIRPCAAGNATLAPDPSAPEPMLLFVEPFTCGPRARALHLRYDLFFDHDALHESFTRLALGEGQRSDDPSASVVVFQDRLREIAVDVHAPESLAGNAALYLRLGVAHILTGYDHLSFLMALLLTAALRERTSGGRGATAASPRQAVRSTIAIVSAFTVAHSLTLITQVLHPGWISTRWVEPAIAFSVAYVGFENLIARRPRGRWLIVFGFGLVHGLGFASVLREIGLPRRGLVLSLVSFNLGVELGQLLVVGLTLPILVAAAHRAPRRFERWGLTVGSGIIAAFGTLWLGARLVGR